MLNIINYLFLDATHTSPCTTGQYGEELELCFSKSPVLFIEGSKEFSFNSSFSHTQTIARDRHELMMLFPPLFLPPKSRSTGEIAAAVTSKAVSVHQEIKTKLMINVII